MRCLFAFLLTCCFACPATAPGDVTHDPISLTIPFSGQVHDQAMTVVISVVNDGVPDQGPPSTVELRNVGTPHVVPQGCPFGVDSYQGLVEIRSFFQTQQLSNTVVRITNVSPATYQVCNANEGGTGTYQYADFFYGSINPNGVSVALPWAFLYPGTGNFTFTGEVRADVTGAVKRVFLAGASIGLISYLDPDGGVATGLAGADLWCQREAIGAGRGSFWKAFVSTTTRDAASIVPEAVFTRLDGVLVATSRADLLDGTLLAGVTVDVSGTLLGSEWAGIPVFSGSTAAGVYVGPACTDWTSDTGTAEAGTFGATTGWASGLTASCEVGFFICVEQ